MEKTKNSLLWGKKIFTSSQCPNCGADMSMGQCSECWYKDASTAPTRNRKFHRTSRKIISFHA